LSSAAATPSPSFDHRVALELGDLPEIVCRFGEERLQGRHGLCVERLQLRRGRQHTAFSTASLDASVASSTCLSAGLALLSMVLRASSAALLMLARAPPYAPRTLPIAAPTWSGMRAAAASTFAARVGRRGRDVKRDVALPLLGALPKGDRAAFERGRSAPLR